MRNRDRSKIFQTITKEMSRGAEISDIINTLVGRFDLSPTRAEDAIVLWSERTPAGVRSVIGNHVNLKGASQ